MVQEALCGLQGAQPHGDSDAQGGSAASFLQDVEVVRKQELERLVRAVRKFFQGLQTMNLHDLSLAQLQVLVDSDKLSVEKLASGYSKQTKNLT